MEELTVPLIIRGSFLILKQELIRQLAPGQTALRCALNFKALKKASVPVKSGKKNVFVCRPGDYIDWQTANGQRVQLQTASKQIVQELQVTKHINHLKLNDRESQWLAGRSPHVVLDQQSGLVLADPAQRRLPNARLSVVLDADLALACGLQQSKTLQLRVMEQPNKKVADSKKVSLPLITENDIRKARKEGRIIYVAKGQLVTPAARALGREFGLLKVDG